MNHRSRRWPGRLPGRLIVWRRLIAWGQGVCVVGWLGWFLLVAGCSAGTSEDQAMAELQDWITGQRDWMQPPVQAEPEAVSKPIPKAMPAAAPRGGWSPFDPRRLDVDGAGNPEKPDPRLVSPPASPHALPPLQAAALTAMTLVGSVLGSGSGLALVRVNGQIYPVRVGDALGPNQGLVTRIDAAGLVVRELLRNPAGQPVERLAVLRLSGAAP